MLPDAFTIITSEIDEFPVTAHYARIVADHQNPPRKAEPVSQIFLLEKVRRASVLVAAAAFQSSFSCLQHRESPECPGTALKYT